MKLKVFPVGKALVPDYEALDQGILRFVGRKHDPNLGPNGGWEPVKGSVEVEFRKEYLDELKAGTLEPADEQTQKLLLKLCK